MKILLVRTKPKNIFASLKTIRFEPLELEYLGTVVKELGHHYEVYDGLIERKSFKHFVRDYQPDIVALTGYTIHVNLMKKYAQVTKEFSSQIKVIVGGIHAEVNWEDFYEASIDVVVYANPLITFRKLLITYENNDNLDSLKNICFYQGDKWVKTEREVFEPDNLPQPDRSHLKRHKNKFRYFGREKCALVKTAWGCCYDCSFCYCARLNNGTYSSRDMVKVISEIVALEQRKIFIIDDDFLVNKERVWNFCQLIKNYGIKKDFSIYGRADLICACEDILPVLNEVGVSEIIVGLEAVDDETLKNYNKRVTTQTNFKAIELLRKNNIASCGLFIVDENYGSEDFRRLSQVVEKMELDLCMFSIFTPLKGVPGYKAYQERLIIPEEKYENNDFLHLKIKPTKLSIPRFYWEFYKLYLLAYTNPKRLKTNFKPIISSLVNLFSENIKCLITRLNHR